MTGEFEAKKDGGATVVMKDIEDMLQEGKSFTIVPIKAKQWSLKELEALSGILVKHLEKYKPDRVNFSNNDSEQGVKGTVADIFMNVADGKMVFASWGKNKDPKIPYLLKPDKVVALTPTVFYLND